MGNHNGISGQSDISIQSGFPWYGKVSIQVNSQSPQEFTLHLRIPSWAGKTSLTINGELFPIGDSPASPRDQAACGYDPRQAWYLPIHRTWFSGDKLDLDFEMPLRLRRAHPHVRGHAGKVALTRGPLVYCLESCDNPGLDIFSAQINSETIEWKPSPALLGGIYTLTGKCTQDQSFVAIPYALWANRGESQMTVWINSK